jgi:hypothetical protein
MPVRLTPYGLRLGLYAANAAENGYRAVQNPENPFNFRREIHMAGRIDHVDPYITPLADHGGTQDADAMLTFLRKPIRHGRALMDFTAVSYLPGPTEYPLRQRRLPRIYVSNDSQIPQRGGTHLRNPSAYQRPNDFGRK